MANPLAGDVQVPALGAVPKKVLIPVIGGAVAFVVWRFYVARQSTGDGESPITDGEFGAVDSSIPGVIGAVKPGGDYGEPAGDSSSGGGGTAAATTNDEWSRRATAELQNSDRYSYADIVEALGNFLGGQPLTTAQQAIVRAAIAVQGYPPVGTHAVISGGDTKLTIAPQGPRLSSATDTTIAVAFSPVAGAARYRLKGASGLVGDSASSPVTARGLKPNTTYSFTVTAVTAAGQEGPASSPVSVKTAAVKLVAPRIPTVTALAATTAKLTIPAQAGATNYRWYLDGKFHSTTEAPAETFTSLPKGSTHWVSVAADAAGQGQGPRSAARKFTLKKK